ncbi:uncharacterized protein LOC144708389 [Wolffia australiana]
MWNLRVNNGNLEDQKNRYGTGEAEFMHGQKFPSIDGSQQFSGESSVYREASFCAGDKFPPDVSTARNMDSRNNLQNGTHQVFSELNTRRDNQRMLVMHNQPEFMNNNWAQVDPNYCALGLQMKGTEFQGSGFDKVSFSSGVAGPSLVNFPSVDFSQTPISQNFIPNLPYFSVGRDSVQPNLMSGVQTDVSFESKAPIFSQLVNYQTGIPACDLSVDIKNNNGSVFYVGAAPGLLNHGYTMDPVRHLNVPVTESNQGYASYYPKIDSQESTKSDPGASEISSETYKKACDALLAYAQRKRSVSCLDNGDGSVKAGASPSETGTVIDNPIGMVEKEPSLDLGTPSFAGPAGDVKVLWDGTLQLNLSTEVSAVAVFKSGEKILDPSWAKFVDIKGKVRLEAFEKFVQELPRSRNRALMVISIHWKVGTPQSGLKGMKEVAKSYKEQQRVGYAQFSPGVDLYVCPRSDAVITILAKHGFLKGMEAVEQDQNSLIGCVIWRRTKPTSEPPKGDEQPPAESVDPIDAVDGGSSSSSVVNPGDLMALLPQLQPLTSQMDLHSILSSAVNLLMKDAAENMKHPPPSQPSVDFSSSGQRSMTEPANEEDLPEFDFGGSTQPVPCPIVGVETEKRPMVAKDGSSGHPRMPGRRSCFDDDDDDDDMPEWHPPTVERQKLPLAMQPPPLLPSPPPPPPLPPSGSKSWPVSLAFEQNPGLSKQDQRGILGQCPLEMYEKTSSMPAAPGDRRSTQSGHGFSPEGGGSRSRPVKQRRTSGWDIRP